MFEKILVPVDGSPLAASALPYALAVARDHASITLMRVVDSSLPSGLTNPIDWQLQRTEDSAYLDELAAQYANVGNVTFEKVVQGGGAAERILEQARDHEHDLIVLSSHGRSGLSSWNVSSVAQKVIDRAGVSILLVRAYKLADSSVAAPRQAASYRRILVPLDGSVRSEYVLPAAVRLAKHHQAELLLVHGIVTPELFQQTPLAAEDSLLVDKVVQHNQRQAERYFQALAERLDVAVETYVLTSDDVAETLHRFAEEQGIDLVVLSAHGRSGKHAWPFGSVTSSFIAYGATHLLIVQDLPWQGIQESGAAQASRISQQANLLSSSLGGLSEKGHAPIYAFAPRRHNLRTTGRWTAGRAH